MSVSLYGLTKRFPTGRRTPDVLAVDDVTLEVLDGELVVVVGPSGSGKSTLLRCIAGLEEPSAGSIEVGGRDVTQLPAGDRDIAMVFQEHALYPHLSVGDNIGFGLAARRVDDATIATKVGDVAALMGLEEVLERRPRQLSGGERQRVALARAIVRQPAAFLMDEPLSDLDAELRAFMRAEIHALQRRLETTTIYVTHDQTEALTMGDRVVVLRAGRIEQTAAPAELYDRPANTFVARFIGSPPMNVFPATLLGVDDDRFLGIRPERLRLTDSGSGRLRGRVTHVETIGHEVVVHVMVGEEILLVRSPRGIAPARGSDAGLHFDDGDVHVFKADGIAR
ncbi:MAG: ABC transporter ATP-binding protein [Actinomycetota bacterium]|nr:ABC transporter ATP-binding protein [Actinomycetota bacterium]